MRLQSHQYLGSHENRASGFLDPLMQWSRRNSTHSRAEQTWRRVTDGAQMERRGRSVTIVGYEPEAAEGAESRRDLSYRNWHLAAERAHSEIALCQLRTRSSFFRVL